MRVGGVPSAYAPVHGAAAHPKEVEPKLTAVSREDLRGAIARAHQRVTGRAAPGPLLDVLTAHASLETASGARMFNYNFGGIKGASPNGETARCRTHEVVAGKEIEVRDGFRAYRSLDEGAVDYVRLMRDRFGGAVAQAERGDVVGFAHALKQARYYTADESAYAGALRRLTGEAGEGGPARGAAATSAPSSVFPDTVELGRVLDAIASHPVAMSRRPDGEDDDA